jgi:hypothetical protein
MTVAEATDIADTALEHAVLCVLQAVQVCAGLLPICADRRLGACLREAAFGPGFHAALYSRFNS